MDRHVFAICAYGESPYLESCIRSLKAQTTPSPVILCTSTPSPYLDEIAGRYNLPVYVRRGKSSIRDDWNFAWQQADGELVTIAHQDDLYHKDYVRYLLRAYERYPDMTVFTTDYVMVKDKRVICLDRLLLVKKLLRLPLRFKRFCHLTAVKQSALLLGNPLCCPATTYQKRILGEPLFTSPYQFALDWDTFFKLAKSWGRFICEEKPLVYYRIHEGATTKACIDNHSRIREEREMFARFWPGPVSRLLMRYYQKAYDTYDT